jgi:hypothetical protein
MATWVGTTGGGDGFSWSDPKNWSPQAVPTGPVNITTAGAPVSVVIAAGSSSSAQPLVLGTTGTTKAVTLTNNGTLNNFSSGAALYSGTTLDTHGTSTLGGAVSIASGALMKVSTGGTVTTNGTISLAGSLQVNGTFIGNTFTGNGAVLVDGGTFSKLSAGLTDLSGSSSAFTITNGGIVRAQSPKSTVSFAFGTVSAGQTNVLELTTYSTSYTGTVSNFGAGDKIIINGNSGVGTISANGDGSYTLAWGQTKLTHVTLASGISASDLIFANGAVVACYAQGTRILTPTGETEIELLAIGDAVVTASGATRPIKWIGRRSYAGRFLADNRQALPVRIAAGALADGVPKRDLLVSPRHAMLIDGALVPADMLLNGVTIAQHTGLDSITYVHLELASHDVLVAEGAASESFVDCDSRGMFHNAAEFTALYPNDNSPAWTFCAPMLAEASEQLAAIRGRLAVRAGLDDSRGPVAAWRGHLEQVSATQVRGWAFDSANPDARVRLEVLVDGASIGHVLANRERADLARAGSYGDGRHGFDFRLPDALEPGQLVAVRRAADGAMVPGSPRQVAVEAFDAAARAALARQLRGVAGATRDAAELDGLTSFLTGEAEWLRAARARLDGGARAEVEDPRDPLRGLTLNGGAHASVQPLALVLDAAAPGEGSAALARMQGLRQLGFMVRFMAWQQPAGDSPALTEAGIGCLGTAWQGGVEEVLRRLGDRVDVVLLQGAATAATYGVLVLRFCPRARVVFGATDAAVTGLEQALATQLADAVLPPDATDLGNAVAPVLRRWNAVAA